MTITREQPAAHTAPGDDDVLSGLLGRPKQLPCRLLYDARGAQLFEQICLLDAYYPTRSEIALLEASLPELAVSIGPEIRVIEPGSGEGVKTRMLLAALERPIGYVPIDVSCEQLVTTAASLRHAFPELEVQPCCADYTRLAALPVASRAARRNLVFFPGSTIGNFEPEAAQRFLASIGALAGPGSWLLLGSDANTDVASLLSAYDDPEGVTAAFNRNVLAHVNRTHAAEFDLDAFVHRAVWSELEHRIEMHLVSTRRQTVLVAGHRVHLEPDEPIVTEHCYKHPRAKLATVLVKAGWSVRQVMADPLGRMHLWLAEWTG